MSLSLTYLDDLSRIRIRGTDLTGNDVHVQRSTDRIRWTTVRGGEAVQLSSRSFTLDDYEFIPGVANYYRAVPNRAPLDLGFATTVTTLGTGASTNATHNVPSGFSLTNRSMRLTLTVDDFSKVAQLNMFVGAEGTFTNNFRWRFNASTAATEIGKNGEQFTIDLKLAEVNSVAGSITMGSDGLVPPAASYNDLMFRVVDDTTGPVEVQLHSVELVPTAAAGGYVSITFDDGHESVATLAKPKMDALGFRGTNYVIVESLDTTDRLTTAEVDDMAADGWEIAGHAYASAVHTARYTGVTRAEAEADLADLYAWLDEHYPRDGGRYSFAYPGGEYEDTTDGAAVEALVRRAGFASGRTILSHPGVSTHLQVAGVPDPMPYRLHAASSISELSGSQLNPDNLIATGGMLDKVASNGNAWLILAFHRIVAGTPVETTEISQTDFDAIMDAIDAKDLTVLPVGEVPYEAAITPELETPWIKSPTRPFLNRPVMLSEFGEVTRRDRSGVFEIVGRSYPVAVTDLRSSRRQTISLLTQDRQERRELDTILASGEPILFHAPAGCAVDSMYAIAGDVSYDRTARRSERRLFQIPLTEVAPPHHSIAGVTVTWQGVINAYATWADLVADEETWETLQELIGDPEDVIVP